MQVPRQPGYYRDVIGDYWHRGPDGWCWIGRRIPWTGQVVPADPGHGPLPDWVIAAAVESPGDEVLPLTRVEIDELPAALL